MLAVSKPLSESDQLQQCRRLARVLMLTKQMLAHAEKGEWSQITELELERRDDLAACFNNGAASFDDTVLVAEAIATLLHLNEELMEKLKFAQTEVVEQGREYTRNRSAVGSYQAIKSAL